MLSESTRKHKAEAPKRLRFGIFTVSTSRYEKMKKGEQVEDVRDALRLVFLDDAPRDRPVRF